jgi:hypothetical protein
MRRARQSVRANGDIVVGKTFGFVRCIKGSAFGRVKTPPGGAAATKTAARRATACPRLVHRASLAPAATAGSAARSRPAAAD